MTIDTYANRTSSTYVLHNIARIILCYPLNGISSITRTLWYSLYTACMWMWVLLPVWGTSRAKKKQWQCFIPYNNRTFFFFFSFLVVFDQQNKWKKKKRIVIICNYCIRYSSGSSYCRCVLITYSRIRATSSTNRLWFFSSSFLVFKRFCLFDLYLFLHFGSVSSRILLAINWVHCFTMLRQNKIPRICDRVSVRAQQVRARTITFALIKC